MRLRSVLVAGLLVGVAGCASPGSSGTAGGPAPAAPDAFSHAVASAHVTLYWNCTRPESNALRLEGIARNLWSAQEIRSLVFELSGVDARGRSVSEAKGEARDASIRTHESSSFQIDLRTVGSEVRFDLYYQYQFTDAEQVDALLAGPPMAPPRRLAQGGNRFLVWDACSESQHRAR